MLFGFNIYLCYNKSPFRQKDRKNVFLRDHLDSGLKITHFSFKSNRAGDASLQHSLSFQISNTEAFLTIMDICHVSLRDKYFPSVLILKGENM